MSHKTKQKFRTMTNAVNTLKELVSKYSNVTVSEVMINAQGERYQYKHTTLKYNHTAQFLRRAFEKAAKEVTGKDYVTFFAVGNDGYNFDRNPYKGGKDGKISIKELILL